MSSSSDDDSSDDGMFSPPHRLFMASPMGKASLPGSTLRLRRLSGAGIMATKPTPTSPVNTCVEVTPLEYVPGKQRRLA